MTLRKTPGGKLQVSKNGRLMSGDADCCCCKCCWCYSGDEKLVNGPLGILLEMDPSWEIVVTDSTLLLGDDAGNFCGVKFLLNLTISDQEDLLDPCSTTGTAELVCDCDICPDDVFWDVRIQSCGDYTIPSPIYIGDGCTSANIDDPNCSVLPVGVQAMSFDISDPDGSVRCQCPGDYCGNGEEI